MTAKLARPKKPKRINIMRPRHKMTVSYSEDLRLFDNRFRRLGLLFLVVIWALLPLIWEHPPFSLISNNGISLNTLIYAGVFAIAAIGLNLLTGYTGQVSLGHSIFLAVGAYFTAYVGSVWEWPMWIWIIAASALGWLIGAAIGPFALRLRGNYLVIVTLGLVFIGEHIFRNWKSVTGGNAGTSAASVDMKIGPLDFENLELFGHSFEKDASLFWLIWLLVAIVAWLVKNVVRTRAGRALQAVRDSDIAAEIIGIDVGIRGYKTQAFAWSAAIAALAGALYAPFQLFISPGDFTLLVSIQFIAMIILGGMGTIYGSIIGALIITALPRLIDGISANNGLPGVATRVTDDGLVSLASLNVIIYGFLIAAFLLFEHRGLAGIWVRVRNYFSSWPFTY